MNCYIIDDEQHAIDYLIECIGQTDNLKAVGYHTNPEKALFEIGTLGNIDVVFTDIRLGKITGFDIMKRLPKRVQVVVTTVNSEFREYATELRAKGYILKPYDFDTFKKGIKKLKEPKILS